jgi:hypothetical protein
MRTTNSKTCNNSSQFITFVRFWNSRKPSMPIVSDFGIGTVSQNACWIRKAPEPPLRYSAQNILLFRD